MCKVCSFTHTTSEFVENCRHKMLSFASFQHFFPQWRKVFHTSDLIGAPVKILTLQIETEVCKKRQQDLRITVSCDRMCEYKFVKR